MNIFTRIFNRLFGKGIGIDTDYDLTIFVEDAIKGEFVDSVSRATALLEEFSAPFQSAFHFFFVPPQATFVNAHENWPVWEQWLAWNIRNPFPGLNDMLGCKGQVFTTMGETVSADNPHGLTWNPNGGFNKLTHTTDGGKQYPFLSFRGTHVEWYIGTRPTGSFGVALRRAKAKGY